MYDRTEFEKAIEVIKTAIAEMANSALEEQARSVHRSIKSEEDFMKAFKCDRCGVLFEERNDIAVTIGHEDDVLGCPRPVKLELGRTVQRSIGPKSCDADLCTKCAASFKEWVKQGRTQNVD